MARRHGQYGQVKMDATGGAAAVAIASLNAWTLDLARDRADVTAFGDTNKQYVQGLPDINGTIGGFWDSTALEMFQAAIGTVAVMLELVPSTLDAALVFSGLAYLDASIEVDSGGAVTTSGTFVGAGDWTMPTVTP